MLLDKEVLVKRKYNYDLDYYNSLGYDTNKDYFLVKIEHLLKKSFTKVNVSCDYCSYVDKIPYYKWNRSMESPIKKYCCKSCKGEKIKESNLLKYGVTSVAKLDSSKEKAKQTSLEKWGVESHLMTDIIKKKIKKTNLEKYGVENPMQSKEVREKQVATLIDKWGVDNISKLESIKGLKKETTLKNWGVEIPLRNKKIKEKLKKTNLERYGDQYFTRTEKYRKDNYDIANDHFYLEYKNDGISIFKCDYNKEHDFEITKDVYSKRKLYNVGLCTICNPVGENSSIKEKDLLDFISNIYPSEIIHSYRDGLEIDIYLPNLNLGFEFNGLYWHSSDKKDKFYHINKTNYFRERGIRIIHIWEDDWDNRRDIIKSQIRNIIGLTENKIFSRKCHVKEIKDSKIATKFLEENHIQGKVASCLKLGLYFEKELVSLMTFDHYEGRNKMEDGGWNINRFCNKVNYSVIGGASKLLKYFINNYDVKKIVSYADKDWSDGGLYEKLGFKKISESKPDYKYLIKNERIHKSRFRKSKIGISESFLNIPKVWNCGKIKFELKF